MSFGEYAAFAGWNVITITGWVVLIRVWRHQLDVGWFRGTRPDTPETAGHHAALGAMVVFCTVGAVVLWGIVLNDRYYESERMDWVLWWILVAGFAMWPLAASLYFFLRPRSLVPPHLRQSPSLASSARSRRRSRRGGKP